MDTSKTEGGRSHFERKGGSLSAPHVREGCAPRGSQVAADDRNSTWVRRNRYRDRDVRS